MGEWRYISTIPDLSFIPWLLYPLGKTPQYPLGPRVGCYGEEKNFASARNQTLAMQPLAIPTELS
jgi:hypothetical protein